MMNEFRQNIALCINVSIKALHSVRVERITQDSLCDQLKVYCCGERARFPLTTKNSSNAQPENKATCSYIILRCIKTTLLEI